MLVTVSDKKIGVQNGTTGTIAYYNADVISAQDYYPGGMLMPGRKFGGLGRHGFNGMESSPEIKGEGNSYTAEYWEYDPRLVRRWNIDPVIKEYESPYMCFSGNPIEPTDHVAYVSDVCGLCSDLHHYLETRHTAEYRYWWRIRCYAADPRLGGRGKCSVTRINVVVPDYFCVDTASLLGAGTIS